MSGMCGRMIKLGNLIGIQLLLVVAFKVDIWVSTGSECVGGGEGGI